MSELIADHNDSVRHGGERIQDSGRHGTRRAVTTGGYPTAFGERRADRRRDEGTGRHDRAASSTDRAGGRHGAGAQDPGRHEASTGRRSARSASADAAPTTDRAGSGRHDSGRHAVPVEVTGRQPAETGTDDRKVRRYETGRFSTVEEAARAGAYDTVTGSGAFDPVDPGFGRGAAGGSRPTRSDRRASGSTGSTGNGRAARRPAETGTAHPSYDTGATPGRRRRAEAEEPTGGRRARRAAEERGPSTGSYEGSRRADRTGAESTRTGGRRRADRRDADAPSYTRPGDSGGFEVVGRYGTGPNPVVRSGEPTGSGRHEIANGTGRYDPTGGSRREPVDGTGRYDPTGAGQYDAANGTGRYEAANGTGRNDLAAGTGRYEAADGPARYDATTGAGRYDAANGTGRYEAANGTGRYDTGTATGAGRYEAGRSGTGPQPSAPHDGVPPGAGMTGRFGAAGGPPDAYAALSGAARTPEAPGRYPTGQPGGEVTRPGMGARRPAGAEATGRYSASQTGGFPTQAQPPVTGTGRYATPPRGTAPVPPAQATGFYPAPGDSGRYPTGGYPAGTGRYAVPGGYGPADATAAGGMAAPAAYGPADATAAGPIRPVDVPVGAYSFADNQPGTGRYPAPERPAPADGGRTELGRVGHTGRYPAPVPDAAPVQTGRYPAPAPEAAPAHTGRYPAPVPEAAPRRTGGYPVPDETTRPDRGGRQSGAELVPVPRGARADVPAQWPGAGEWSGRFPVADPGGSGVRTFDLVKDYGTGAGAVRALNGITVDVQPNAFTAIMGPSGSGKSTLLHCMAGLDVPTSGRVFLGSTDLTSLPEKKLTRLRRERVGFVFQSYALLPQLSVRQNIVLPLEVAGRKIDDQWLKMVVEALDLGKVLKQRATKLSGGQQQRVAMARALLPRPDVVFADEPTGALDAPTAREMLQFLRTSVHELGQTIVMVTHDPLAAEHTDHVLLLHQGGLAAQIANPTAPVVLEALTILDRMPAAGWQTGGYRAAIAAPAPGALPVAPRLALPAGPSAARPA